MAQRTIRLTVDETKRESERIMCRGQVHFSFQETENKTIHSNHVDARFTSQEPELIKDSFFLLLQTVSRDSHRSPLTPALSLVKHSDTEVCILKII